MPWNSQGGGGGPWGTPPGGGNNGNNPWGRPPGGNNGPQPPDLEDLFRKGQDRLKRAVPGGVGGGSAFGFIALALLVIWLASGIYRVQADEQGVELTFGQVSGAPTEPGLHYHWPYPIQTVYKVRTRFENQIVIGAGEATQPRRASTGIISANTDDGLMLTGDENIIDIIFAVRWVIEDPQKYLFQIRDPEETVRKAAESAIRETIGRTDIDQILSGTGQQAAVESAVTGQQISEDIRDRLQAMLNDYQSGLLITGVELRTAEVPKEVIEAFLDVRNASQARERLRNEAEAYRNKILPEARGEAERMIQEAEAYREQAVNLARGDAQRFSSIYEAYSLSQDVTARRMYLETMEQVLRGTNKIIIDDAKGGQGVLPYLPLNELARQPSRSGAVGGTGSGN